MNIKKIFHTGPIHPVQMVLFILIELLLLFGKEFSKFHLFWHFHLYDLLFLLLAGYSGILFLLKKDKLVIWPVIILIGISVIYLVYSYLAELGPINYMVRHYALFVYLIGFYIIFGSYIDEEKNRINVKFIILIAIASFGIQVIFHIYNLIFTEEFTLFNRWNYFSFMTVMGLVVFAAYILVFIKNRIAKSILFIILLFISVTLGHSSAFLSCFTIFVFYFMLTKGKLVKISAFIFLMASVIAFFQYYPEFTDRNARWRVLYWTGTLKESILEYYGILGHGFGTKYLDRELMQQFQEKLGSGIFDYRPEEQYLSPMHNSFITIFFHVGILPGLLLFAPLKNAVHYFLRRKDLGKNKISDFLILSFIGVMIWTSFNVILELPHSSAFFWLIYFTLIYWFRNQNNEPSENLS